MVMAIIGGAVVTPALGYAQTALGIKGLLFVLILCLAYLMVLGVFAAIAERKDAK